MNRLTHWNKQRGQWGLPQGPGSFRMIAERLAAYENTGMEPETIWALIKAINNVPDVMPILMQFLGGEKDE